jgi:phenylalanine-4-hydroxylase
LRTYGAGILSSGGEIGYCLESPNPNRIGFDLLRIMQTRYKIDTFQETYFVIRDFQQLFDATAPDFTPYYERCADASPMPLGGAGDRSRLPPGHLAGRAPAVQRALRPSSCG